MRTQTVPKTDSYKVNPSLISLFIFNDFSEILFSDFSILSIALDSTDVHFTMFIQLV